MEELEVKNAIEDELAEGWSRDDMLELLGECEFALSRFEGRIDQLEEKGLRRLYNVVTGINRRNKKRVLHDIHDIQEVSLEIQRILMRNIEMVSRWLSILSNKVNDRFYWTDNVILNLYQKLTTTDIDMRLLKWQNNVRNNKTQDQRKYIEVSDGMKILLIVSDLFGIIHSRIELIEEAYLETVKDKLNLKDEINIADFYKDILQEKCFPLYIREGYFYKAGNISEYGDRIRLIADAYSDEHMKEVAISQGKSIDDLCRETYIDKCSKESTRVKTVELCQKLLSDLAWLDSKYQSTITESGGTTQIPTGSGRPIGTDENEQPNSETGQNDSKETGPNDLTESIPNTNESKEEPKPAPNPSIKKGKPKIEYSLLKVTPEGRWMFHDGSVDYDKIDHDWKYEFFKKDQGLITQYLEKYSPYMVTAPKGYFNICDEITKGFLLNKTRYVPLADYYMYLWFQHEKKYVRKKQKIALLEYYDRYSYVSGYEINESEDGYRRLFSDLKIYKNRNNVNVKRDIRDKFKEFTLIGNDTEILMIRTFIVGAYIDKLLNKIDVKYADAAWEDILKANNDTLGEIIRDIESKSKQQ